MKYTHTKEAVMQSQSLTVIDAHATLREQPRWITSRFGRGYWTTTQRSYNSKPRLYIGIENESILENFAFRTSRPSRLYKSVLPEILAMLGLPADTKATWNQKARCSCGCSPGFVLDIDQDFGYGSGERFDYYATVRGGAAQTTATPEALAVAENRVGQLAQQGIIAAMTPRTGRSDSGRLRNFKAMSAEKLSAAWLAVTTEANDQEALNAIVAEMSRRTAAA